MKTSTISPRFLFITGAILLAALNRLLPHAPNFTPIGAMALFGGVCYTNKKFAFVFPLLAMVLSDLLIDYHNTIVYVYLSFILITGIGIYLRNKMSTKNIILASLSASILFFLISNFGVWAEMGFPAGINGLVSTYLLGIPFYSNDLFGSFFLNNIMADLFYSGILFGSYYIVKAKFPVLA